MPEFSSYDGAEALSQLKTRTRQLEDLYAAMGLLSWDLETTMPPKGSEQRAQQMATLSELSHERLIDPCVGKWLDQLKTTPPESLEEQAWVREATDAYEKAVKLPASLVRAFSETTSQAHLVWVEARKTNNFSLFEPLLTKIVYLNQQKADALGYEGSPYNALLDLYEPKLTTQVLDPLFASLKNQLVPLVEAIKNSSLKPQADFLSRPFPKASQQAFVKDVITAMGFDWQAGRMDEAPHPFCSGTGVGDVRLTNRYLQEDWLSSLFSGMHEAGHGLYEQGCNPEFGGTPLAGGVSLGVHESQSRFWENLVGRREAFWQFWFPKLKQHAGSALDGVDESTFYAVVNRVEPSFIRVEADEVTYNLHVMLRYEIEKALIEGQIKVSEVPEAWNAKMQSYLGIIPPSNTLGCLQDIHWAHGSFGYFPTYTLGNLISAQVWHAAEAYLGPLETLLAQGNLLPIRQWLQKNIHQYGKLYTPNQLIQKVCGEPLNAKPFTDYLWKKYSSVYQLN